MVGYETDEQQWEAIKGWFNKNGNTLTWAFIIIASIFLAGRYYLHHKTVVKEQASEHYFAMIKSEEEGDFTSMESKANRLINDYNKTSYAQLAAMMLAKHAVQEGHYDEAANQLQWILDKSKNNEFKQLARIRLMKVFIAQKDYEAAKELINEKDANGWLTLMQELKGDIFTQSQEQQAALEAYKQAVLSAPEDTMHGPLLTHKLNDLGLGADALEALKERKEIESE